MPPRKPHPKGKLRGWEKEPPPPPPDPEPEPDLPPDPSGDPTPTHSPIVFVYLHRLDNDAAPLEVDAYKRYLDDLRLWMWEKSGGLTWYHSEFIVDGVYEDTVPSGYNSYAHFAQDYAGAIHSSQGKLGMVLFNSKPDEGGYAGAYTGHAAHGFWAIDAMAGRPFPEEPYSGWQKDLWPGTSLGGYAHELCHAFGDVGHWPGLMSEHWNWPNTYLDQQTIAEMEKSPWLARGPRPETGNWRRWS